MYTLLYILVGLVALIFILAMLAPKTYEVSRNISISKPVSEVFEYLGQKRSQHGKGVYRKGWGDRCH